MILNQNQKLKKTKGAIILSIVLAIVFGLMQAMEIKSASTSQVTITTTVADTISLNCTTPVALGSLTPGTPVFNTDVCTTTTNAAGGYNLAVKRDDADTTLDLIGTPATNITDKTAWDPTYSAGAGNAAAWAGTGLGFSVYASTATKNTTWWGSASTCAAGDANKYAGFPSAYADIMRHTTYSSGSTTVSICYKLDTPGTQVSGSYDGTVTFQATATP